MTPARIKFASWMLFEMYALKMYPGRTAKDAVATMMFATIGISCPE
jgi:hypothetical protein